MYDINHNSSGIASTREMIINLTDVPTDEALRIAESVQTRKIRIRGVLENKIRNDSEKALIATKHKILSVLKKWVDEELESMGGKFDKKFSDEQIEQMAFVFPRNKKMTILSVQENYRQFDLSWRQAQKIIEKNKEMFPNRWEQKN